jgi:hypothetical protein
MHGCYLRACRHRFRPRRIVARSRNPRVPACFAQWTQQYMVPFD